MAKQIIAILSCFRRSIAIWVGERPAICCLTRTGSVETSCSDISVGEIPMATFLVEAGTGVRAALPGEARHIYDPGPK